MILQTILSAFLLFFPLIRPSSKIGTTNQMQRPIMIDNIILVIVYGQMAVEPPAHET
jgi:hypothetical protein